MAPLEVQSVITRRYGLAERAANSSKYLTEPRRLSHNVSTVMSSHSVGNCSSCLNVEQIMLQIAPSMYDVCTIYFIYNIHVMQVGEKMRDKHF